MKMQVKIEKKGKEEFLTITVPMGRSESASGKSIVVASTRGNIPTEVVVDGKPLVVSVNAYIKK